MIEPVTPTLHPLYENPRLYLLVPSDMDSLNPGKAVAQAAHAATSFMWSMLGSTFDDQNIRRPDVLDAFREWVHAADLPRGQMVYEQGFGTKIAKHATPTQIDRVVSLARVCTLPAAIVHDPTYPLKDGDRLHLLPLNTCAYVFCGDQIGRALLGHLDLMP